MIQTLILICLCDSGACPLLATPLLNLPPSDFLALWQVVFVLVKYSQHLCLSVLHLQTQPIMDQKLIFKKNYTSTKNVYIYIYLYIF